MSPVFPTIYSTLDPQALALMVAGRYNIAASTGQLLVRGVGDTYLIQGPAGSYILRVYRTTHRSLDNIRAEVTLLTALKQAGVSVSFPISDQEGQLIQELDAAEGKRYAVLFSYAPGKIVNVLTLSQLHSLGQEMARFHHVSAEAIPAGTRWNYDTYTTLQEPLQRLQNNFATIPDEYNWWQKATTDARLLLEQMPAHQFASGYCHYDFLPKNFHFEEDAITLFDFDFLGQGWLVNDIMTFWTHLCLDVHFNRITQLQADKSFDALLEGYHQHRSMSAAELKAIPYLSLGWWCYYMGFHATHDQFTQLVHPAQLAMRTGVIRPLAERYWYK